MNNTNLNNSLSILRDYVESIHDTIFGDTPGCFLYNIRKLDTTIQLCKTRCKICMNYSSNPWNTNELVNLLANFDDIVNLLGIGSTGSKDNIMTFTNHRNQLKNCIANIMAIIGDCNWEGSSSMFQQEDYKEIV